MSTFDLTQYRVVTAQDVDAATQKGAKELLVQERAIITGAARDMITARGLTTRTPGAAPAAATGSEWDKLFFSPEAEAVQEFAGCLSQDIWRGLRKPTDCPSFGRGCKPDSPLGATMVSANGTCAAYYKYRKQEAS